MLLRDLGAVNLWLKFSESVRFLFKAAEQMEKALGAEKVSFIESCQRDRNSLPIPDGPLAVGIDGGFIRAPQLAPRNLTLVSDGREEWSSPIRRRKKSQPTISQANPHLLPVNVMKEQSSPSILEGKGAGPALD